MLATPEPVVHYEPPFTMNHLILLHVKSDVLLSSLVVAWTALQVMHQYS